MSGGFYSMYSGNSRPKAKATLTRDFRQLSRLTLPVVGKFGGLNDFGGDFNKIAMTMHSTFRSFLDEIAEGRIPMPLNDGLNVLIAAKHTSYILNQIRFAVRVFNPLPFIVVELLSIDVMELVQYAPAFATVMTCVQNKYKRLVGSYPDRLMMVENSNAAYITEIYAELEACVGSSFFELLWEYSVLLTESVLIGRALLQQMEMMEGKEEEEDMCPICMEELQDRIVKTNCNHRFHDTCLTAWLRDRTTCPYCRRPVSAVTNFHNKRVRSRTLNSLTIDLSKIEVVAQYFGEILRGGATVRPWEVFAYIEELGKGFVRSGPKAKRKTKRGSGPSRVGSYNPFDLLD